jgi:hypothetical protein
VIKLVKAKKEKYRRVSAKLAESCGENGMSDQCGTVERGNHGQDTVREITESREGGDCVREVIGNKGRAIEWEERFLNKKAGADPAKDSRTGDKFVEARRDSGSCGR